VRPNNSLANMARCILDSADKTNLSRLLSEAPWREDAINHRRIRFMLQRTKPHRRRRRESLLAIDDTLCEHVGGLFDYVDRHYNHGDGTWARCKFDWKDSGIQHLYAGVLESYYDMSTMKVAEWRDK
jgi:hypothetical protein